jgi:hypothetical protein
LRKKSFKSIEEIKFTKTKNKKEFKKVFLSTKKDFENLIKTT